MNFRFTPLCAPESAPSPAVSTVTSSIAPSRAGTVPKKLVPPLLNPFDELLMPSMVGLIVPPGMPLKCVPPPTGCTTPGLRRASPNVLRPGSGSSLSTSLFSVPEIVLVVASSTGAAPVTVTDSPIWPTSSVARTSVVRDDSTITFLMTAVLNPWRETVSSYEPKLRSGNVTDPDWLVVARLRIPVRSSLSCTSAPGTTRPALSKTVPVIAPAIRTCAPAPADAASSAAQANNETIQRDGIAETPSSTS